MKRPQKGVYKKFYVHEKILRTRNCRRRFIKNVLPEKRKKNMQTKQPRLISRLNELTMGMQIFASFLLYIA